jgi:hypothetical protein
MTILLFFRVKQATTRLRRLRRGKSGKLLKAVCKGAAIQPYDLGVIPQGNIDVLLRTGTAPRRWCSNFSVDLIGSDRTVVKDGSDGKKYLAKNCNYEPGLSARAVARAGDEG